MKPVFNHIALGTRIECHDKNGNPILKFSGILWKHIGEGHALIKMDSGLFWPTCDPESYIADTDFKKISSVIVVREHDHPSISPEMTDKNTISYPAQLWTSANIHFGTSNTYEGMLEDFNILQQVLIHAKGEHFLYQNNSL